MEGIPGSAGVGVYGLLTECYGYYLTLKADKRPAVREQLRKALDAFAEARGYLRLWVDGKTGGRWLIAKHRAAEPLRRLHARQLDIAGIGFDELLASTTRHRVFRFSNGYQPQGLNGSFRRLMRDSGLLKSADGQNRTLYSLRHTYATLALLDGMDIHTLAKQMGNSAAMIERHYSKLTATMAAARLARRGSPISDNLGSAMRTAYDCR